MTDATPAEIMRRLDDVSRQLLELASQMREDRNAAAKLYLPREFYNEARKNDQADVADVARDVEALGTKQTKNDDFRKQVVLTFALFTLTTLVTIGIAVSNLLSR